MLTSSLHKIVDTITWQVRGVVETDTTRPVIFGLRDLCQRKEISRRTEWAREITAKLDRSRALVPEIGFAASPIPDLDMGAVCTLGRSLATEALANARMSNAKGFHINKLLPEEKQSTLLSIALNEQLLAVVTDYLGIVPVLVDMDYFCSLPVPASQPFSSSQLYHCDDTSMTLLKLFVYCDRVTNDDGPLQALGAARSHALRKQVHYRYGGSAYRVRDEAMSAILQDGEPHAFLGEPGTWFLIDTARCFHRGSRIRGTDRQRMVAYLEFAPPNTTRLPLRLERGAPYAHLALPVSSPLGRAVLGVPAA